MTHSQLVHAQLFFNDRQLTLCPVDAQVGKSLFEDAILKSLRNRGISVILVTHALHLLSQCDYIYSMNDGYITEHGTYQQLLAHGGEFARLDKAFGGMRDDDGSASASRSSSRTITVGDLKSKSANVERKGAGTGKLEGHLIVRTKYLSI
jgi:ATP-binding cassette, subfamily C (CFTR/MRP), member 1